jgi:DNA-binding response OmpR family regulator
MPKPKTTILVVEDDKFISNAYKAKFESEGFKFTAAFNGEEALQILQKTIPDIIILDLVMPIKNGFEVLKEVKKSKSLNTIPIIVATNLGEEQYIIKAKEMGANDYMLKSELSLSDLVEKVRYLLTLHPKQS